LSATRTPMSTMLVIAVNESALHALSSDLEQRLKGDGSPTKTPEELADVLEAHTEKTAKLRAAHLDSVRDRARRESERAQDAARRRLRLAAARVDKVQRKLFAADTKVNAKKEASEAEREARKARREEMAQAVAEARTVAAKARAARQAALLDAEKAAFFKHAKSVQSVVDKSAWQVKHAIAVVAAQKEKERADAAAASDKLSERLELAAGRRALSPAFSPPRGSSVRHRVLNEEKVASLQRKKLLEASMDKAATNREAILKTVADKASAGNAHAARVAAAAHAKAAGTDAGTRESKAALYDRLLRAEVARLTALKHKYTTAGSKCGDTVSVIVVKVDKTPRMPPPALSLRLSAVCRQLTATAAARQKGAASRRAMLRAKASLRAAQANERRAAVLRRIAKARSDQAAAIEAKEARSIATLGLAQGAKIAVTAEEGRRIAAAAGRRAATAKLLLALGEARHKAFVDALERQSACLRVRAKAGVVAVRGAANKSRRDAAKSAAERRGEALAARCTAAAEARAAFLAARVTVARKRMKALHPKTKDVTEVAVA